MTKSTSNELVVTGPRTDGIDHDMDQIWLWLGPKMDVAITGSRLTWSPANAVKPQFVYVGWLKQPSKFPEFSPVAATLNSFGITAADYPTILARDPFAGGSTTIDPSRFVSTGTTFTYEPPYAAGDAGVAQPYTMSTDLVGVVTTSATDAYGVGTTTWAGIDLSLVGGSLSAGNTWTWTSTNTLTTRLQTTQTATASVNWPSPSYTGPTLVDLYYDTIYGSFLFAFENDSTAQAREASSSLKGHITSGAIPAARQEVLLDLGGKRYRTYANARGQYYFPKGLHGAGRISVRGVARPVMIGSTPAVQDVKL